MDEDGLYSTSELIGVESDQWVLVQFIFALVVFILSVFIANGGLVQKLYRKYKTGSIKTQAERVEAGKHVKNKPSHDSVRLDS